MRKNIFLGRFQNQGTTRGLFGHVVVDGPTSLSCCHLHTTWEVSSAPSAPSSEEKGDNLYRNYNCGHRLKSEPPTFLHWLALLFSLGYLVILCMVSNSSSKSKCSARGTYFKPTPLTLISIFLSKKQHFSWL